MGAALLIFKMALITLALAGVAYGVWMLTLPEPLTISTPGIDLSNGMWKILPGETPTGLLVSAIATSVLVPILGWRITSGGITAAKEPEERPTMNPGEVELIRQKYSARVNNSG